MRGRVAFARALVAALVVCAPGLASLRCFFYWTPDRRGAGGHDPSGGGE